MQINQVNLLKKSNYINNAQFNNKLHYFIFPQIGRDEVSFGARAKLLAESMADAPRWKDCNTVNTNAEPSRFYLQCVLDKYISQFVKNENDNNPSPNKPIIDYFTRVKSSNSIREKVVSKFAKIYREDVDRFCAVAIDQILNDFNPCTERTKEQLIEDAKKTFAYSQLKIPPFENAAYFLNQIMTVFDAYNIFDFSKKSPEQLKSLFTTYVKNIEAESISTNLDKNKSYINPQNINGIKHYANDVVGARIIMSDSSPKDTAIVLDALKQAAMDGYIKINSVENNIPDPDKLPSDTSLEDYEYATSRQLYLFTDDTNSTLFENISKSGYMAIHINVELTDPILHLYKGEYKGYNAEIQIIGSDVEKLKDVEDLCYKLKDNKNAINAAYLPFKMHFLKYYTKDVMKDFDDYTYALYLAQRALMGTDAQSSEFPSIKELGFEGKVPPELDFNVLKKIKSDCDVEFNKLLKAEEESVKNSPSDTISRIKKAGDISTIKNMISCKIK